MDFGARVSRLGVGLIGRLVRDPARARKVGAWIDIGQAQAARLRALRHLVGLASRDDLEAVAAEVSGQRRRLRQVVARLERLGRRSA